MEKSAAGTEQPSSERRSIRHILKELFAFTKKFEIKPVLFLGPIMLSLLAAVADGLSIGLLVPTVQGVVKKSFLFIFERPVLGDMARMLPVRLHKSDGAIFILLIGLIFFSAVTKNILYYLQANLMLSQVREIANRTRKLIYERYLSFGKGFFDRVSSGHLHQMLVGHTQQIVAEFYVLQQSLFHIFVMLVFIAIGFFISWKLMLFAMIVFPVLHFSLAALIRKIRESSKAYSKAYAEMGTKISNALSCVMLIKAYMNEPRENQWFAFTSDRVRNIQRSLDKKRLLIGPFQEIVSLCVILLLVGFMAYLMIREKTGSVAGFFIFFIVLRRASQHFGVFNSIQGTLAGIWGPLQDIRQIFSDEDKFFVPEGTRNFDSFRDKIEFKGLDFRFAEGRPILKQVSFSVKKGTTVAVVGSSGSGKTTLINLLMRFYDSPPGTILIDGTDIREFTLRSLRGKMALVSQDTYLLNAPFKINLIYGLNREVSDTELENVTKKARLWQLIKLIGMDAPVGERGIKLSGGEKQRLSIARAILKDPGILILDEATSALDTVTEGLVHDALEEAAVNKTVIVIAHRLSTIQNADRIVVIEKGTVVEEGTFEELLTKKDGYFYLYWQRQKLINEE